METSHCCMSWSTPNALKWSTKPHQFLSMFIHVRCMPRPLCVWGLFPELNSETAMSLCSCSCTISRCIKGVWQSSLFIYGPSHSPSGTFLLPAWRSLFCSCTAVYQVETLAVKWEWKNMLMTSNLIPKNKNGILWKFLQQKQRLWILQTPALQSVF